MEVGEPLPPSALTVAALKDNREHRLYIWDRETAVLMKQLHVAKDDIRAVRVRAFKVRGEC